MDKTKKSKDQNSIYHYSIYGVGIIAVILAFLGIIFWGKISYKIADNNTTDLGEFYLKEISERNISFMTNEIEHRKKIMENSVVKIDAYYLQNITNLQKYLTMVQSVTGLNLYSYLDENNAIYTDNKILRVEDYSHVLTEPISDSKTFCIATINNKPMLLITVPVDITTGDGIKMVSCVSGLYIDSFFTEDKLSGKKNQSVCEVYLKNGIPLAETRVNPIRNQSLFDYYERNAVIENGITLQQLKESWAKGESGYYIYDVKQFGKTYLYYNSIPDTDIMVITFMRESDIFKVIADASRTQVLYGLIFTTFAVILAVVALIFIFKLIKRDKNAQLETEMERKANKAKSTFLFNMSHDIRTPMNAIVGYTQLAEKSAGNKKQTLEYMRKIQYASDVLMSLINNVLEIARIESGNEHLEEGPWSFNKLNQIINSIFDIQMKEKGIEFTKNINVTHQNVICDSIKVREILLNLLSNAYKYTPKGGKVSLTVNEIPSGKEGFASYRTIITDSGQGMSQEFLPHIFESFSRERTTTESKIMGSGLGMQIVKQYVDLMGGTIDVESVVGKGTSIAIILTHQISENDYSKNIINMSQDKREKYFKGKRVLLVEDNEMNAEIATAILKEFGLMVEVAGDGVLCLEMLKSTRDNYFDLILMDVQMPNMDGYEATRRIRLLGNRSKACIPIIAMTANAFDEDIKAALEAGMNSHIAKPIDTKLLLETILEYI